MKKKLISLCAVLCLVIGIIPACDAAGVAGAAAPASAAGSPGPLYGSSGLPIYAQYSSDNETQVYTWLVISSGFNTAAICGLMANIAAESNFDPTATGDNGTSYGLFQWHDTSPGSGRWTALKNYSPDNWQTIPGQLSYLMYELRNSYKSVYSYLQGLTSDKNGSVTNDAKGAYNAGYYFCYNFEIPANRDATSQARGNTAQNTYWPKYKSIFTVSFDSRGGSAVPPIANVAVGSKISKPAADPTYAGYTFGGWYKDAACTNPWNFASDTVTNDVTLYAKWVQAYFTVTFNTGGAGSIPPVTGLVYGSKVQRPADPALNGSVFFGWFRDAQFNTPWDFANSTVTGNTTLYAKWISETYRFPPDPGSGYTVPINPNIKTVQDLLIMCLLPAGSSGSVSAGGNQLNAGDRVATGMTLTVTDGAGSSQSWMIVISGDVNGDGKVTAADALIVLKQSVHALNPELSGAGLLAADVDKSGEAKAPDALAILKFSVGALKNLPLK